MFLVVLQLIFVINPPGRSLGVDALAWQRESTARKEAPMLALVAGEVTLIGVTLICLTGASMLFSCIDCRLGALIHRQRCRTWTFPDRISLRLRGSR